MNEKKIASSFLGIELGSTRIKAVLIGDDFSPVASAAFEWENRLQDGYWTYSLDLIKKGVQECFAALKGDVLSKYGVKLTSVGAIGISAMMHGYMAFDEENQLLAPFRTWRNTTTAQAAEELTAEFGFNIPQRWSVAHLYQAILNNEPHIGKIASINTLAGYIHFLLSGKQALGAGDASGMFPIDCEKREYDGEMLAKFDLLAAKHGFMKPISTLLPRLYLAGENCGVLTAEGAAFLDPEGDLLPNIPLCPPEGDAGTGMTATNSVLPKTGNVSAGTSIFAMLVLDKPLKAVHTEIDIVATPDCKNVAMAHCNNCSCELDAWVSIFSEFLSLNGITPNKAKLYDTLYIHALSGDPDCGGIIPFNYLSGEGITNLEKGCPMLIKTAQSRFNLANLIRSELYSAFATLKLGMNILIDDEQVGIDKITAHGGIFKTKGVAQQILADALNTSVSVMSTVGEGGAWGMALLAAFMVLRDENEALPDFLSDRVFGKMQQTSLAPTAEGVKGFTAFMENYSTALTVEKAAVEALY